MIVVGSVTAVLRASIVGWRGLFGGLVLVAGGSIFGARTNASSIIDTLAFQLTSFLFAFPAFQRVLHDDDGRLELIMIVMAMNVECRWEFFRSMILNSRMDGRRAFVSALRSCTLDGYAV